MSLRINKLLNSDFLLSSYEIEVVVESLLSLTSERKSFSDSILTSPKGKTKVNVDYANLKGTIKR